MPYYHEPDPQTDLDGLHKRKKDGATVRLTGKGKHFDRLKNELERAGYTSVENMSGGDR